MKYLYAVALLTGGFEVVAAAWLNDGVAGRGLAAVFAVALLGCGWLIRRHHSVGAASVVGVLLLVELLGLPFYARASASDWVVQIGFGVASLVGVIAWVQVLLHHRQLRPA